MNDTKQQTENNGRRDKISYWAIIAIIFYILKGVFDIFSPALPVKSNKMQAMKASSADLDSKSSSGLISTDLETKVSFISTFVDKTYDKTSMKTALKSAEEMDTDTHNAYFAARRVIILRGLLDIPANKLIKKRYNPFDAFDKDLPSDISQAERDRLHKEQVLWRDLFTTNKMSKAEVTQFEQRIKSCKQLRWWVNPALTLLYKRSGDLIALDRQCQKTADSVVTSVLGSGTILMARMFLTFVGFIVFSIMIINKVIAGRRRLQSQTPYVDPNLSQYPGYPNAQYVQFNKQGHNDINLWPSIMESIPDHKKKIGAGELAEVFILFLIFRDILILILLGFGGYGAHHYGHFKGVLSSIINHVQNMSVDMRVAYTVGFETVLYVLSAIPSILMLIALAKKKSVSLADEINLKIKPIGNNIFYGVYGYAIASPLILVMSMITGHLLKNAPDPSNPVIPIIMAVKGTVTIIAIIGLTSIAAPIVEELLFRGVLFNALKLSYGVWPAIIISGLVFGSLHPVGIAEILVLSSLGCVFAWMTYTRQSLMPSMTAHCINNLTSTLLLLFLMQ